MGSSVKDINISSVVLEGQVQAVNDQKYGFVKDPEIKDRDSDGFKELMVKFPRKEVIEILPTGEEMEVSITGQLNSDISFEGTDYIKVVSS